MQEHVKEMAVFIFFKNKFTPYYKGESCSLNTIIIKINEKNIQNLTVQVESN